MADGLDTAVASLTEAKRELEARLDAIDAAIEALQGNGAVPRRQPRSVGEDKLAAVRQYIIEAGGPVRQSEIHKALGMNSGTVSTALEHLEHDGVVARLGKVDRSETWAAE